MGRSLSPQGLRSGNKLGRLRIAFQELLRRHYRRRRARFPARDLNPHQRHFAEVTKSVSLRRKKRYTTEKPRTERARVAARFSGPHRLIFSFWARATPGRAVHARFSIGGE
jgi:hypothetical protein